MMNNLMGLKKIIVCLLLSILFNQNAVAVT